MRPGNKVRAYPRSSFWSLRAPGRHLADSRVPLASSPPSTLCYILRCAGLNLHISVSTLLPCFTRRILSATRSGVRVSRAFATMESRDGNGKEVTGIVGGSGFSLLLFQPSARLVTFMRICRIRVSTSPPTTVILDERILEYRSSRS